MKNQIKKNDRGFSLVGAMIALSITAVVAVNLMQIVSSANHQQVGVENKSQALDTKSLLMFLLSNPNKCKDFVKSKDGNPALFSVPSGINEFALIDFGSSRQYREGDALPGSPDMRITDLKFGDIYTSALVAGSSTEYTLNLEFKVLRSDKGVGGKQLNHDFVIKLVSDDASGTISSCNTIMNDTISFQLMCQTLANGTWNNITMECETKTIVKSYADATAAANSSSNWEIFYVE
jgi:hypothetical protein